MAKQTDWPLDAEVQAIGEVRAVALQAGGGGSFELLLENGDVLTAAFTDREEMIVTNALRLHNSVWLEVKGLGAFDDAGKLKHISHLKHCQQVPALAVHCEGDQPLKDSPSKKGNPPVSTGRSILKMVEKIHRSSPKGTWDDVPIDLGQNWHDYKYGRRRKAEDG